METVWKGILNFITALHNNLTTYPYLMSSFQIDSGKKSNAQCKGYLKKKKLSALFLFLQENIN